MTKKINFKPFTDNETLAKEQKLLVSAVGNMDNRVQRYLMSEVLHIEEYRNPTRLNRFFALVKGKGTRNNAMHAFVQRHANVIMPEGSQEYKMRKARTINKDDLISEMLQVPWWLEKKESEPKQFSLEKKVETLLKAAITAAKGEKMKPADKPMLKSLVTWAEQHGFNIDTGEDASIFVDVSNTNKEAA